MPALRLPSEWCYVCPELAGSELLFAAGPLRIVLLTNLLAPWKLVVSFNRKGKFHAI